MIRFSLFGIPAAIRPSFWLVVLLLGFDARIPTAQLAVHLASWAVIVLVSVLAHELGHALLARSFGAEVSITLFALGGYTTWESSRPLSHLRRAAVAAAGSVVGFLLASLVWWLSRSGLLDAASPVVGRGLRLFVVVNLFWGVLNWLPIRPLDGGHIFSALLQAWMGDLGEKVANVLFPVATLAAAFWAWQEGLVFAAMLAAFVLIDELRRWGRTTPAEPVERFSLFGDDEAEEPPRARQPDDGTEP